jgi:single-strand DNA-binding protein
MNNLIIKGRLTSDPELKNTSNATEYCDFTVAVDRYAGKDKEKETDFIPCRAWRQTAVFVQQYFKKGQEILVGGEIRFDKYEKDGEKRTYSFVQVNRVEFCGGKRENSQMADTLKIRETPQIANFETMQSVSDEDLPF